jgi:hypothetical protein
MPDTVFINNLVTVPLMIALIGRNILGCFLRDYVKFQLSSAPVRLTMCNHEANSSFS